MYNVRVSAEFSANIYERYNSSGTERREGDLSEIHVADIYHRKFFLSTKQKANYFPFCHCMTRNFFLLRVISFLSQFNQNIEISVILSQQIENSNDFKNMKHQKERKHEKLFIMPRRKKLH